jgi:hypothetical protein
MPRSHASADPQAQQADAEPIDQQDALPYDVLSMMSVLQPGDAEPLAKLLATYPSYREQILAKAGPMLGNKTVQQALAIGTAAPAMQVGSSTPSPQTGTVDPRDVAAEKVLVSDKPLDQGHTSAQDAAAATALYVDDTAHKGAAPKESAAQTLGALNTPEPGSWEAVKQIVWGVATAEDLATVLKANPQYRQQILDEAKRNLGDAEIKRAVKMADAPAGAATAEPEQQAPPKAAPEEPKPGDKPPGLTPPDQEAQAAWIGQARAYNNAHTEFADEFLGIVGPVMLGEDGLLDPTKVAHWQREHGLEADGKVGPHTVAAARQTAKPGAASAVKAEQDALPDDDLRKQLS